LSHSPSLFVLCIFLSRVSCFPLVRLNPPIYDSDVAGNDGAHHHAQLLVKMGFGERFAQAGNPK
jgi:hypothetical protein